MRGINPHAWFYEFRESLDADHARAVLAGAAAEQWFNAELFRSIARTLPHTLTVYPELGKKDLAIVRVHRGVPAWEEVEAIAEVKLIYSNYTAGGRASRIRSLLAQVAAASDQSPRAYGWVVGVYSTWRPRTTRESFASFRRDVGTTLRTLAGGCSNPAVLIAKPTMETLVDEGQVAIGGAVARVGAVAQYVVARRGAASTDR